MEISKSMELNIPAYWYGINVVEWQINKTLDFTWKYYNMLVQIMEMYCLLIAGDYSQIKVDCCSRDIV